MDSNRIAHTMASTNSESKSLFAAGGEANSDKESIWQQVLAQSAKKTQPLPSKTILLLGNSLLAAFVLQFGIHFSSSVSSF